MINSAQYCQPVQRELKPFCPCSLTPFTIMHRQTPEERTQQVYSQISTHLQHRSKEGTLKNDLNLAPLHRELEQASLLVQNSGSSNMLVGKISFDCLIQTVDGKEVRDYIHFDLQIPGTGTERNPVFSYEMVEGLYAKGAPSLEGKRNLYRAIQALYTTGRDQVNPDHQKHGHEPSYDPSVSQHDQYIRHTEQMLAAYLNLPEASEMLINRLTCALRGSHPEAASVKLYHMGIHLHSTKTCCAPCEYTLVGLMNSEGEQSLRQNLKTSAAKKDSLHFSFPRKSSFQIVTTVTATTHDADHRKVPPYNQTLIHVRDIDNYFTYLDVKNPLIQNYIFTAPLFTPYDARNLAPASVLSGKSLGISGSESTKGTAPTKKETARLKQVSLEETVFDLSLLKLTS